MIDEGKLTNFITNKRREFGKVKDIYRMHNLILEPVGDNISYQDMMNKKENCILVEGVKFGFYNVLDKTYRLMCGDSYQINDGKIVGKIDNLTILGNAYDLVNQIEKVGADMETCIGRCIKSNQMVVVGMGAPSIQLKQVRVVL